MSWGSLWSRWTNEISKVLPKSLVIEIPKFARELQGGIWWPALWRKEYGQKEFLRFLPSSLADYLEKVANFQQHLNKILDDTKLVNNTW
jgi:hypothetical protein